PLGAGEEQFLGLSDLPRTLGVLRRRWRGGLGNGDSHVVLLVFGTTLALGRELPYERSPGSSISRSKKPAPCVLYGQSPTSCGGSRVGFTAATSRGARKPASLP